MKHGPPRRLRSPAPLALALLAALAAASADATAGPPGPDGESDLRAAEALSRSIRRAVDVARPSIVTIRTTSRRPVADGDDYAGSGDATGVIVDRAGGVLTNNHVVADADAVFVRLPDGREFAAAEVRGDPWSDLAVVRVRGAGDLPAARLAGPDAVGVGDWVIAAGNSFGLGLSVNPGTVSAERRRLPDANVPLLQTNAVSNPGNSGGPLLDLRGEVVGICEGGYSEAGGFDGVAFAIPADVAAFVARELAENGSVPWAYLGVDFETASPDLARVLALPPGAAGAVLTGVADGGPAAEAGLRVGDVVTRFAGAAIGDEIQMLAALAKARPGDPVEVTAYRGGAATTYAVRPGRLPRPGPPQHPPGRFHFGPLSTIISSKEARTMQSLRSGEVARRAGVNVETLRFYERAGILPEPPRRASGYREYPPETVDLIRFVKRAQELGFSLKEVQELLDLRNAPRRASGKMPRLVKAKLDEIDHKVRDLEAMRRALEGLLCACEGKRPGTACPILESLSGCPRCAEGER